jgi:hypothetical protein
MTIPNRPTRGLKIVYALLAELGLELEALTALQRELIRLAVNEQDSIFENVRTSMRGRCVVRGQHGSVRRFDELTNTLHPPL